ncbi:MAG TPA: SdrD B-like domain-containing protein [Anaerolineae bacterium]|nr:SdrD B-like domain-containing protein [Anaerolineae bacterium]HQK15427.1 SdrD B-like domain-containing protein [Anaerolineae bacterium]
MWSRKMLYALAAALCALSVLSVTAVRAEYGPNEGTIRGMAFIDSNRNGKMDANEKGLGWVYFTISNGSYSHTYFSEWQTTDSVGNTYATGTFGPAPLAKGGWKVTFHTPEGYVPTTPTEQVVYVPGKEGGHVAYVYMGFYPKAGARTGSGGGVLPASGMTAGHNVLYGALALFALGSIISVGLGLSRRHA